MSEPVRTCAGCAARAPQASLVRFVAAADGLALDRRRRAAGRGAYLHGNPACWEQFVRRKGPIRSLRRSAGRPERERLVAALAGGAA